MGGSVQHAVNSPPRSASLRPTPPPHPPACTVHANNPRRNHTQNGNEVSLAWLVRCLSITASLLSAHPPHGSEALWTASQSSLLPGARPCSESQGCPLSKLWTPLTYLQAHRTWMPQLPPTIRSPLENRTKHFPCSSLSLGIICGQCSK